MKIMITIHNVRQTSWFVCYEDYDEQYNLYYYWMISKGTLW